MIFHSDNIKNLLHHGQTTLRRLINALLIMIASTLLVLIAIIPLYFLAEKSHLFINIPALFLLLAFVIYLIIGWTRSAGKRAVLAFLLVAAGAFIPIVIMTQANRNRFFIALLCWIYSSTLIITLTNAIPALLKARKIRKQA